MKISVSRKGMFNAIVIYLPKEFKTMVDREYIVIKEEGNEIIIREATIMDQKIFKLIKSGSSGSGYQITYTSETAMDYVGECSLNKDDDNECFILTKN